MNARANGKNGVIYFISNGHLLSKKHYRKLENMVFSNDRYTHAALF